MVQGAEQQGRCAGLGAAGTAARGAAIKGVLTAPWL
jgi:hypothetical protein